GDLTNLLKLTKEDINLILESRLIEEAAIHLLYDISKDDEIPLVVNLKVDDPRWYKNNINDGELRQLLYAVLIIFRDVEDLENIKLTPELILSISDGTMDTNGDGVVDENDENELKEIMESKILSDTIIKFIYDYYKDMNKNPN